MEGFIEDMQKLPWNYKDAHPGLYGPSRHISRDGRSNIVSFGIYFLLAFSNNLCIKHATDTHTLIERDMKEL